jgi:biotin carboxyl carrier protein
LEGVGIGGIFGTKDVNVIGQAMKKKFIAVMADKEVEFFAEKTGDSALKIHLDGHETAFDIVKAGQDDYSLLSGEKSYTVGVSRQGGKFRVVYRGETVDLTLIDEKKMRRGGGAGAVQAVASGEVTSPMPGRVVKIHVSVEQQIKTGDGLVVVEAMKMENEFKSPKDGVVKAIKVKVGDSVEGGAVLVVIE